MLHCLLCFLFSATVIITIRSPDGETDIDFNPPTGSENPTYNVTVAEESTEDKEIFLLAADDPVTGDRITDFREVAGSDPLDYFDVEQDTGESWS